MRNTSQTTSWSFVRSMRVRMLFVAIAVFASLPAVGISVSDAAANQLVQVTGVVRDTTGAAIANAIVETANGQVRTGPLGRYTSYVSPTYRYVNVTRDDRTSGRMPQVQTGVVVPVSALGNSPVTVDLYVPVARLLTVDLYVPVARLLTVKVSDSRGPVSGVYVRTDGSACSVPSGPWRQFCSFRNGIGGTTNGLGEVVLRVVGTGQLEGNLTITAEKAAQIATRSGVAVTRDSLIQLTFRCVLPGFGCR